MIQKKSLLPSFVSTVVLSIAFGTTFASEAGHEEVSRILLEAREAAANIKDPYERTSAIDHVLLFQVDLDQPGARDSLRLFPDLLSLPNRLESLAYRYARAGNVHEAKEVYEELLKLKEPELAVKFSRANALGHVALAYANAGQMREAYEQLAELKKQYGDENLAIFISAPAAIAEVQAGHGDQMGGIALAKSIAGEHPYPLMNIVGRRVPANDLPGAMKIVSSLDEGLQQYAKWGIASAQRKLNQLQEAQAMARSIKPGHARANAFLELADHYVEVDDKVTATTCLQEAASAASASVNEWARADILWRVAASTANAGNIENAIKLARSIEKDDHKRFAIRDIAKAQAKQGAFKEAFDTADLLPPSSDDESGTETYVHALTDIFTQMVRANRTKEARETASRFDDLTSHRARLYSAIASAQADSDDVQGARMTLSYAESDKQRAVRRKEMARLTGLLKQGQDSEELRQLRKLQDREYDTLPALEAIALAYARRASLTEASKIANDLDAHKRSDLYKEMGRTLVVSGRKAEAFQWARSLSSPADKAYVLVGIASAIATSKPNGNLTK